MAAGSKAIRTGANFRAQIKTTLECSGFTEVGNIDSYITSPNLPPCPIFARNVLIGLDVYGNPLRVDFIYMKGNVRRILHARWQQTSGSVDQKFPFFAANAQQLPLSSIFVLGGDGFKDGAKQWLENQTGGRIYAVFGEEEFQEWMNNGNF